MNSLKDSLKSVFSYDVKNSFKLARSLNRKLIFFVGPTNSGKTFEAFKELLNCDTGYYLAPLRLLALEGYEKLKSMQKEVSLITGEDQKIDIDASYVCSTIEMCNFNIDVDIAIIDEVQMLNDKFRGWAWINAIVGVPAKKVILTGSKEAIGAVKELASYLNEELTIKYFERKNELKFLNVPISLNNIPKHSALITFSRSEVLKYKSKLSKKYKVSIIYGNLSPEVRQEEAKRFRENRSDILIATDAISMGLNLPIKTIVFTTDTKFDGEKRRKLLPNEVIQISSRAGRYGLHESGFVSGLDRKILKNIKTIYNMPVKNIKSPFSIKPTMEQIYEISRYLNTNRLTKILTFYKDFMVFDGPFRAFDITYYIQSAKFLDKKRLTLEEKYMFAQAPVDKIEIIMQTFFNYIDNFVNKRITKYRLSRFVTYNIKTEKELLRAEDEVKRVSLYLWFAFKEPKLYPDTNVAYEVRNRLNSAIEQSLKKKLLVSKK